MTSSRILELLVHEQFYRVRRSDLPIKKMFSIFCGRKNISYFIIMKSLIACVLKTSSSAPPEPMGSLDLAMLKGREEIVNRTLIILRDLFARWPFVLDMHDEDE